MPGPGNGVQATPEGMSSCAIRLETAAGTIKQIRESVLTSNSDMLSTWNGQAANAFQGAMMSWTKETSDIIKALEWLQDMMTQGGRYYADSEEAVEQAARELLNKNNLNTVGTSGTFFKG